MRWVPFWVFAPVGLLMACDTDAVHSPSERAPIGRTSAQTPLATIDEEFASIARGEAPGFAGVFYEDGQLVVLSAFPANDGAVLAAGRRYVERRPSPSLRAAPRELRRAEYDFHQLNEWRKAMGAAFTVPGVQALQIDERRNRVVVGVTEPAAMAEVRNLINASGIPSNAILMEYVTPPRRAATLTSYVRPVPGAVSIQKSQGGACTMMANAIQPAWTGDLNRYFVTNSHCTMVEFAPDTGSIFQPHNGIFPPIGAEVVDPPPTRTNCSYTGPPSNFAPGQTYDQLVCRYSDSAIIRFNADTGFEMGYLARPITRGSTSIEINATSPRIRISYTAGYPVLGQTLDKIGITTGWQTGQVTATCVDWKDYNSVVVTKCYDQASIFTEQGDSGGPVFEYQPDGSAHLYGITARISDVLWFSSVSGISTDFAGANYHLIYN